jgi:hypothetical protein
MHKAAATLAIAVIGMSGLVLPATATAVTAPASTAVEARDSGDQRRCVTRREFQRVERGWLKSRVHDVFDGAGRRDSLSAGGGTRDEWRTYRTCEGDRYSSVDINFDNYSDRRSGMRVYSKSIYISS